MATLDFTRDYYSDLELPPLADLREVDKAFDKLCDEYYLADVLERNKSWDKFARAETAHAILSNPAKKAQYDQSLRGHESQPKSPINPNIRPDVSRLSTISNRRVIRRQSSLSFYGRKELPQGDLTNQTLSPRADTTRSESQTRANVSNTEDLSTLSPSTSTGIPDFSVDFLSTTKVEYLECQWEIPALLEKFHQHEPMMTAFLADYIVLVAHYDDENETEDHLRVEATTCMAFVKQHMGETGCELLLDIAHSLIGRSVNFSYLCRHVEHIDCANSRIILKFRKDSSINRRDSRSICNTVSWLCSAVRLPRLGEFAFSSTTGDLEIVDLSRPSSHSIRLRLDLSNQNLPALANNCWQKLFVSGTVALGPRNLGPLQVNCPGKGLKVSFDLLMQISAVEFLINVGGQMVLVGHQTALLPVRSGLTYVQFHLEVSETEQLNPYDLDCTQCLPWNENALAEFRGKDCYLGWCESAEILLGTRTLPIADLTFSGSREKTRSVYLDGLSAGLQLASTAPLQAGGSIQANFRFQTNRLRFTPSNVFSQILRNTSAEIAFLYDVPTKRSWIVPKLSLLLHMCHAWRAMQVSGDEEDPIPFVEPYTNVDSVVKALENRGDTVICGKGNDALSLRTLLIGFNINLLHCIAGTSAAKKRKLYGFDFMDVVTEPGRGSCMRAVELGPSASAWLQLAESADALVICAGIGDVIRAKQCDARMCKKCNTLPCDKDCLATPVLCLKTLMRRHGKLMPEILHEPFLDITSEACLVFGEAPFPNCNHDSQSKDTCWDEMKIFQRIRARKRYEGKQGQGDKTWQCLEIPVSGAIALGC